MMIEANATLVGSLFTTGEKACKSARSFAVTRQILYYRSKGGPNGIAVAHKGRSRSNYNTPRFAQRLRKSNATAKRVLED
jgi:hypothetical protein